jgi:hypothetical protein
MTPGTHRVKFKVTGFDGKLYTKRVRFRRC